MSYARRIPVEFNHCDPAGIVFYPRYFEMINSVVENFFADVVGQSFAAMMGAGEGVPTARLDATFQRPSRLGDQLDWHLCVTRLGSSSVGMRVVANCDGAPRLTADLVLVRLAAGRPDPWPKALRARLSNAMEPA